MLRSKQQPTNQTKKHPPRPVPRAGREREEQPRAPSPAARVGGAPGPGRGSTRGRGRVLRPVLPSRPAASRAARGRAVGPGGGVGTGLDLCRRLCQGRAWLGPGRRGRGGGSFPFPGLWCQPRPLPVSCSWPQLPPCHATNARVPQATEGARPAARGLTPTPRADAVPELGGSWAAGSGLTPGPTDAGGWGPGRREGRPAPCCPPGQAGSQPGAWAPRAGPGTAGAAGSSGQAGS